MPRTVKPITYWAGLSKVRQMARSSPGNPVVLNYARRLDSEAESWDEIRTLESVFNSCGLSIRWDKETVVPGFTIKTRGGVEWAPGVSPGNTGH